MDLKVSILLFAFLSIDVSAKKSSKKFFLNYASGVTVCDDDLSKSWLVMKDLRASRYNETVATLIGEFEFNKKIEGLWKINVLLEKVTNSGSETIATHVLKDFCGQIKNKDQDTMYGQYIRAVNFPAECPLEGKYYIDNMVADTKDIPLNSLLVGDYRLTFTFVTYEEQGKGLLAKSKETFQGCLFFVCSIEQVF